jgi:hypothetical protein
MESTEPTGGSIREQHSTRYEVLCRIEDDLRQLTRAVFSEEGIDVDEVVELSARIAETAVRLNHRIAGPVVDPAA